MNTQDLAWSAAHLLCRCPKGQNSCRQQCDSTLDEGKDPKEVERRGHAEMRRKAHWSSATLVPKYVNKWTRVISVGRTFNEPACLTIQPECDFITQANCAKLD
jgi:hypothetical protein